MKTRNSLVSNSSSASFIIKWKSESRYITIADVIDNLFIDVGCLDDATKKAIIENTKRTRSDIKTYTSTFRTSMFNDFSDFGSGAANLSMALMTVCNFELVSTEVKND